METTCLEIAVLWRIRSAQPAPVHQVNIGPEDVVALRTQFAAHVQSVCQTNKLQLVVQAPKTLSVLPALHRVLAIPTAQENAVLLDSSCALPI